MSYYLKRIAVLKQVRNGFSMTGKVLSGLAKAEKTGLNLKITLSMVNIAPVSEGAYFLAASGGKDVCFAKIGKDGREFSTLASPYIDIEGGFSCLVCFVFQAQVIPVAFGQGGTAMDAGLMQRQLENYLSNSALSADTENISEDEAVVSAPPANLLRSDGDHSADIEMPVNAAKPSQSAQEILNLLKTGNSVKDNYQDEIVVTDNYYLYNDVDLEKLTVKESDYEPQDTYNEKPSPQTAQTVSAQDDNNAASIARLFSNSGSFDDAGITRGNYFAKVKKELETLFAEHPSEPALEKNIPGSQWAKIYYMDGKYYTVGLITDNKQPAYICYGVPGKYSKEPPEELKGFCSYLPLSLFDLKGDGYWMMYQSAKTGECVHIDFI